MSFQSIPGALFIACSLLSITACGGGSSGGNDNDTGSDPVSQAFAFSDPGPVKLYTGDSYSNPAAGEGTGSITYSSSDDSVVSVDSVGLLTAHAPGSATITAQIASDQRYLSASATYTVSANLRPNTLSFQNHGPLELEIGHTVSNPAHGRGTGAITYKSSDNSVVSVDNDGLLTVHATGNVTISAEIAADGRYRSASSSFTVNAILRDNALTFEQSGPLSGYTEERLENPATGNGSGEIRYLSSDENVARVDADGSVSLAERGVATITATQAAGSIHAAASNDYQIEVKGRRNSLSFSRTGPVVLNVGDQVDNPATGEGGGVINYHSSDSTVALVDDDGNVSLVSPGRAHVTATQVADSEYAQTTASYAIQAKITMDAWMGREDAQVAFPEEVANLEFRRSREFECGLSCSDTESDILTSEPIVDGRASLSQTAYYHLINDSHKASITASQERFQGRDHHEVVNFKGRLWLVGGRLSDNQSASDIWSSTDGVNWDLELQNAPFGRIKEHKLLIKNERLWLIGEPYDERVWSSNDGKNWKLVTDNVPFTLQSQPLTVVLGDKIWLIEGQNVNTEVSRIWSTKEGEAWQLERNADELPKEGLHELVNFNGKLLLYTTNGIWSSDDAINWQQSIKEPEYRSGWERQHIVTHKNKLWLIEAPNSSIYLPVWYSDDGLHWTKATDRPGLPDVRGYQLVSFKNKMFVIAGDGPQVRWHNRIWGSTDGAQWSVERPSSAGLPRLNRHKLFIFNNTLHLYTNGRTNPIRKSENGINWSTVTPEVPFSSRIGYQLIVFEDTIFVIGGFADGEFLNDIWQSEDGSNWNLVTDNAPFSPRTNHQLAVHNEKLWLIGGQESCGTYHCYRTDIWSSTDGNNWTKEKDEAEFHLRHRSYHRVVSHNGKLWFSGDTNQNDVWYSEDGITWQEATSNAEFSPRDYYQLWSHNGSLWLAGGTEGGAGRETNDIWRSDNGSTWMEATDDAEFSPRQRHQILPYSDSIWLIGGGGQVIGTSDVWRSDNGISWRKFYRRDFIFSQDQ